MKPRVTLALPVYNGEKYVASAIRSILDQDYKDFELIITDNASTDGTEKICRDFAARDPRIRYVRNDSNIGAGPNQNKGFALASGEYLKWCACDDLMSPNFVGACVAALDRNPDAVLAYGTTRHIDQDGRPIVGRGRRALPELDDPIPARRFRLAVNNAFWTIDQEIFGLFRVSALRQSTLHRPYWGSDHAVIKEMALLGRFVHVPGIIFYNREHQDRASRINNAKSRLAWQAAQAKNKHAFESWKHLMHLSEIAYRHRQVAPLKDTLPSIVRFAFSPRQFTRCLVELAGVILPPSGEERLRHLIRSVLVKWSPPPSFELADDHILPKN